MLTELDTVMGPLSLASNMNSMVRYIRQGVDWLRLDSHKRNWPTSCLRPLELLLGLRPSRLFLHVTRTLSHPVEKKKKKKEGRFHLVSSMIPHWSLDFFAPLPSSPHVYVGVSFSLRHFYELCFRLLMFSSVDMIHTFHVLHLLWSFLLRCQMMSFIWIGAYYSGVILTKFVWNDIKI